jgi:hypothetical protein
LEILKGRNEVLPVAGVTDETVSHVVARLFDRVYGILHFDPLRGFKFLPDSTE